jgi:hypothetical protein
MLRRTLLVLVSCIACYSLPTRAQADPAATRSAEQWLVLVDAGDYASSWQQAGTAFRSAVSSERWQQASSSVRSPLGQLRTRTIKSSQATRSLPGAPDGQYVVLQFESSFVNKAAALETVTTVLEPEGSWRVIGYFIK